MTDAPLMECVPNFSEGRRPEIIAQIRQAIEQVSGISVLDVTSDVDHNRSVITFVGEPDAVQEAAFAAIQTAAQLIDMRQHEGQHPRLGATDVVPFVPLRNLTLEQCADYARQLGRRVGQDLQLPVYLYEAAATRPERRNLADVRRGEYDVLVTTIDTPERQPDFGPAIVGTAGAVIIGARDVLIAFNVFLKTNNVDLAKTIARDIRQRDGGLAGVKALGLLVKGQAQVSMNIVNYRLTPLHGIVEKIQQLAHQHGVEIDHSELIGLLPEDVVLESAAALLKLPRLLPSQLLRPLNTALA